MGGELVPEMAATEKYRIDLKEIQARGMAAIEKCRIDPKEIQARGITATEKCKMTQRQKEIQA